MKEKNVIFKGYKINSISMKNIKKENSDFEITSESMNSKKEKDMYKIILIIEAHFKDYSYKLDVEGYFKFLNINNDEEINNFLKITGPSILYPYCRSYISILSGLKSNESLLLPVINFANINK